MIIGNKLLFGYGDIGVGFDTLGLSFTQLKPPAEVGTTLSTEYCSQNGIEFGKKYNIPLELNEISILKNKLNKITAVNCIFEFKGFIFDFSKYNKESVNVVLDKIENIPFLYLMAYAC